VADYFPLLRSHGALVKARTALDERDVMRIINKTIERLRDDGLIRGEPWPADPVDSDQNQADL